jgi:hypothetical protein
MQKHLFLVSAVQSSPDGIACRHARPSIVLHRVVVRGRDVQGICDPSFRSNQITLVTPSGRLNRCAKTKLPPGSTLHTADPAMKLNGTATVPITPGSQSVRLRNSASPAFPFCGFSSRAPANFQAVRTNSPTERNWFPRTCPIGNYVVEYFLVLTVTRCRSNTAGWLTAR